MHGGGGGGGYGGGGEGGSIGFPVPLQRINYTLKPAGSFRGSARRQYGWWWVICGWCVCCGVGTVKGYTNQTCECIFAKLHIRFSTRGDATEPLLACIPPILHTLFRNAPFICDMYVRARVYMLGVA